MLEGGKMSKEQWGHGFHNGYLQGTKEKQVPQIESLIGKWFLSFNPKTNNVVYQGKVISACPDNNFLVQLYSWSTGDATDQKIVPFKDMVNWNFYSSDEDMRFAYYKIKELSQREIEDCERDVLFWNGVPREQIDNLYPRN
jgi:hypothetical protein